MKKKIITLIIVIMLLVAMILIGFVIFNKDNSKQNESTGGNNMNTERTGWAKDIPANYKNASNHQGKLETIHYDTKDYTTGEDINNCYYLSSLWI